MMDKTIEVYHERAHGLMKVFLAIDDEGNIISRKTGNRVLALESGIQFYVQHYIADQIDKVDVKMEGLLPVLTVRDGEEIETPEEPDQDDDKYPALDHLKSLEDAAE
ncbi:hypothetical protein HXA35_15470 [Bacillus sp. A301a_S52]|jgi:hypothetical protein|nr:hypothetical protein [Bacillus sp. A301a_S52]